MPPLQSHFRSWLARLTFGLQLVTKIPPPIALKLIGAIGRFSLTYGPQLRSSSWLSVEELGLGRSSFSEIHMSLLPKRLQTKCDCDTHESDWKLCSCCLGVSLVRSVTPLFGSPPSYVGAPNDGSCPKKFPALLGLDPSSTKGGGTGRCSDVRKMATMVLKIIFP